MLVISNIIQEQTEIIQYVINKNYVTRRLRSLKNSTDKQERKMKERLKSPPFKSRGEDVRETAARKLSTWSSRDKGDVWNFQTRGKERWREKNNSCNGHGVEIGTLKAVFQVAVRPYVTARCSRAYVRVCALDGGHRCTPEGRKLVTTVQTRPGVYRRPILPVRRHWRPWMCTVIMHALISLRRNRELPVAVPRYRPLSM